MLVLSLVIGSVAPLAAPAKMNISRVLNIVSAAVQTWETERSRETGRPHRNVIFFHPDGFGLSHWGSLRTLIVGTDGRINWDRLPHMAPYTGHMKDGITGTSHGEATVHETFDFVLKIVVYSR